MLRRLLTFLQRDYMEAPNKSSLDHCTFPKVLLLLEGGYNLTNLTTASNNMIELMVDFFNCQRNAYLTLESNGPYKNQQCCFEKTDISEVRNNLLVDLLVAGADILSCWKSHAVGEELAKVLMEIEVEIERRTQAYKNQRSSKPTNTTSVNQPTFVRKKTLRPKNKRPQNNDPNTNHCSTPLCPQPSAGPLRVVEKLNISDNSSTMSDDRKYHTKLSSGGRQLIVNLESNRKVETLSDSDSVVKLSETLSKTSMAD